jgi:hypothetical protein
LDRFEVNWALKTITLFAVIFPIWAIKRFVPQKKVYGNARHGPPLGPANISFITNANADLA